LRVLQDGAFERVGGNTTVQTDVRVVAATHRDLEADVASGRFRADLYYRLSVFPIRVPPLRERIDDVPLLVEHFLRQFERKLKKPLRTLTPESRRRLLQYSWPGNIRELQNVIERACVLAHDGTVEIFDRLAPSGDGTATRTGVATLEQVEREHIERVLELTGGIIQGPHGAAHMLGIHPNTLRSRMDRLGIHASRRFSVHSRRPY